MRLRFRIFSAFLSKLVLQLMAVYLYYTPKDNLEAGSAAKVVDCILGLKAFYEWKLSMSNGNGLYKHMRSPLVMHSATRIHGRSTAGASSDSCRRLFDMSTASEKQPQLGEVGKLEGVIGFLLRQS